MTSTKAMLLFAAIALGTTLLLACGDDDDDDDSEELATAAATDTPCPTATGGSPTSTPGSPVATADPEEGDDDDDDDNSGSGSGSDDDDDDDDNSGSGGLPAGGALNDPALLVGSPSPTATLTGGEDPCPPGVEDAGETAQATVDIVDFGFEPTEVDIEVGQTIGWTNVGDATHTVTADDSNFDSGDLDTGAEFTFTFVTAGEFAYHCERHPEMEGTIRVQ